MTKYKGIDVSSWQKNINWGKISDQIDFVIIRSGFGNSISQKDNMFESHIKGAIDSGIKHIGIYHFSYADSVADAEREADVCMEIIEKYKSYIDLPVAFDWEYDSYNYVLNKGIKPTKALVNNMGKAFCNKITKNGYKSMLYTNPDYAGRFFNVSDYDYLWIAQYADELEIKEADFWQYTSKGKLNDYDGNLDLNYCLNSSFFEKKEVFSFGDSSIGVLACKELLLLLYAVGEVKTKVDENGKFGTGTLKAVKEIQKKSGMKQTGEIDSAFIKAMKKLLDNKVK